MSAKGWILAVDDTPASLKLLTELLREQGYEVRSALDGELALRSALAAPPDLALLDVRMPGLDGFELCRRLRADPRTHDVPVIFVSALSETDEKVKGFELGAVDFVTKPYQRAELLARVHTHLELRRLRHHLEDTVAERTAALRESEARLRTILHESVASLAAMVELRDPYTAGHQRRTAHLAVALGTALGLPEATLEGLRLAAVVHDVGKIRVPAEVLTRPGTLTPLEYGIIQEHPRTGYELLHTIDFPWPIADIVYQHHERWNGSGFPRKLAGEAILLEARIVAVADVVEAMISHRPYRPARGVEAALDEVLSQRGTLYDPRVVDACVELVRNRGYRPPG